MNRQRLKIIGFTLSVFLAALIATGLFVLEILKEAKLLDEQVTALATDQSQASQLIQLKKVVSRTESDRDTIASYYLQSQADSIDFLNFIEELANNHPITLETIGATEVQNEQSNRLAVRYDLQGSLAQVEQFIEILETIPYASELMRVNLQKETALAWKAAVTIEVIILDHEASN